MMLFYGGVGSTQSALRPLRETTLKNTFKVGWKRPSGNPLDNILETSISGSAVEVQLGPTVRHGFNCRLNFCGPVSSQKIRHRSNLLNRRVNY